jgi:formylglycine-generating enzyme required for sulfatase activity
LRAPLPQQIEREEPALKPLIQRTTEGLFADYPVEGPLPEPSMETPTLFPAPNRERQEMLLSGFEESSVQSLSLKLHREPVVTHYHPEKREIRVLEPLQTEMSVIRGGTFIRGSNEGSRDEAPCHKITLPNFALDIYPVTNEQFLRFLDFVGGEKDQNYNDLIRLKSSRLSRASGKLSIESGYAKHPVVGVTWYGAHAYARWVGKRLPTEAEWEVAAQGGREHCLYPTGNQIEKNQANFFSSDTTSVMSYTPNPYGLYDMAGNVYEWCQDWYGYTYYETAMVEPNNPKGPSQGVYRVLRGGCWKSLPEDMRCSCRHRNNPGAINSTYGFRCAADVQS